MRVQPVCKFKGGKMNQLSRTARKKRAAEKKEAIRKEFYNVVKRSDGRATMNKAIKIMMKRNPQESHLVQSVVNEIKLDPEAFGKTLVEKYGAF